MSGKHVAEQAGCEHRICSPEESRLHTGLEVTAKDAMRHLRTSLKPDLTRLVKSQAFGKHQALEGQVPFGQENLHKRKGERASVGRL
jgi:hypothetical protein